MDTLQHDDIKWTFASDVLHYRNRLAGSDKVYALCLCHVIAATIRGPEMELAVVAYYGRAEGYESHGLTGLKPTVKGSFPLSRMDDACDAYDKVLYAKVRKGYARVRGRALNADNSRYIPVFQRLRYAPSTAKVEAVRDENRQIIPPRPRKASDVAPKPRRAIRL